MTISRVARRRGLFALLLNVFFMWGGFFMVVPLISIHYVNDLGWAASSIGLVLGLRQLFQQGLTLVGGALADRVGVRRLICAGMLLRAVGFMSMAWASSFVLLLAAALLAALGGALYESPSAAAMAALTDEADRGRFYAISGVTSSLATTFGSLVGVWLLRVDFALVAFGAAGCFCVTFVVTLLWLPPVSIADRHVGLMYGVGLALRDRPFMFFNFLLMGYWFMWVQPTISLPLVVRAITGTSDGVSWVYMLQSGMSVVLQYPLLRVVGRFLRPVPTLVVGMVLMAGGLAAIALVHSLLMLLVCVAVFSVGGMLAWPSQQMMAAELSSPAALGSYFGVNALALAFGGGLGNYSGGWLYGLAGQLQVPALPWLVFGVVGTSTALGLLYQRHLFGGRRGDQ